MAEGVVVEGEFEAVVVAVATDEGDDVVFVAVAADVEQQGVGVEGDGDGVGRDGAHHLCGFGIGAPVDGVDGHAVAVTEHGDGT